MDNSNVKDHLLTVIEEESLENPCCICFEELDNDITTMECCGTEYHTKCIKKWLHESVNTDCPNCRAKFVKILKVQNKNKINSYNRCAVAYLCCCNISSFIIFILYIKYAWT